MKISHPPSLKLRWTGPAFSRRKPILLVANAPRFISSLVPFPIVNIKLKYLVHHSDLEGTEMSSGFSLLIILFIPSFNIGTLKFINSPK